MYQKCEILFLNVSYFFLSFIQTCSRWRATPRLMHNVQIDVRQHRMAFSPGLEYLDLLIH